MQIKPQQVSPANPTLHCKVGSRGSETVSEVSSALMDGKRKKKKTLTMQPRLPHFVKGAFTISRWKLTAGCIQNITQRGQIAKQFTIV